MAKEVDYESLKERFDKIKSEKSPYREIREKLIKGGKGEYKYETKEYENFKMLRDLKSFNENLAHGDLFNAKNYAFDIMDNLIKENLSKGQNPLTKEDKLKYLNSFNKRIERGLKYLEKHPSEQNIKDMKDILKSSKHAQNHLRKGLSSGLEKSLAILSIGSVFAGLFFLSLNLTGNTIGNIAKSSGNILGGVLFALGIAGIFISKKF